METTLLAVLVALVLILIIMQIPKTRLPRLRSKSSKDDSGLGLEEVIQSVTDDVLKSQKRIRESGGRSMFFVDKAQVTLSFVVKKTATGAVRLVAAEGEAVHATEQIHQVTLDLVTTPPLMGKVLESLVSKHETLDAAVDELLASDKTQDFLKQYEQKAGE